MIIPFIFAYEPCSPTLRYLYQANLVCGITIVVYTPLPSPTNCGDSWFASSWQIVRGGMQEFSPRFYSVTT